MENIDALLEAQYESGEIIQGIIRNFRKDSAARKQSASYFNERWRRLDEVWEQFQSTDTKIRDMCTDPMNLEYFSTGYYDKIGSITTEHLELFKKEADRLAQQSKGQFEGMTAETSKTTTETQRNHPKINPDEVSMASGIVRGVTARLMALDRILKGIKDIDDQPAQYYELKINTITKLWNQIEALHYEAHELLSDPGAAGLNQNKYDGTYDAVQEKLVDLSVKLQRNNKPTQSTAGKGELKDSPLHLPKVTIPQFNGDYLKWRQFHDMFSEIVDKQPIPAIQKMWYLKSNVSGEAEHLITQFSLSEENYSTAWNTLKERYNNKRVLVSNFVERILNQPIMTSSASSIKTLHDTTKECLLALNNLGIPTASWDAILIQLLMKKLDRSTHIRYIQSLKDPKDVPAVAEFLSFLELQFQSMEAITQREEPKRKAVLSVASSSSGHFVTCKMCNNGNHHLYHCDKFRQLSEAERLGWVQQQGLCVNCFKKDHSAKTCTSGRCKLCSQRHNTLLHLPKRNSKGKKMQFETPSKTKTSSANEAAVATATANNVTNRQGVVLLATARVTLTASNGMSGEFRAILDSGSQVNLVSERLVKKLSVSPTESSLRIDGVGKQQKRASHRVDLIMKSIDQRFITNLEAHILPTIIPAQNDQQIDISSWDVPQGMQLADPHFYKKEKIDILLGAELFFRLIQPGTIRPSSNLPIFQNTSLGWVVAGRTFHELCFTKNNTSTCAIVDEPSLEEAVEQLWKMDEIESHATSLSPAEKLCESHFVQHVNTNDDGRFIVKIPFKNNPEILGDSHALAFNRFLGLERRLQKNAEIREKYTEFMQQYIQLGHMQRIDINALSGTKYFIPHHCVLKPDSSTTKLRVVFDASAKTASGYSLNDLMHTGPTVQGELFSILLRFRLPRFVFTTDIEKMYRQILIHPDDRRYQLVIWREDPSQPLHYYKLNTVTYGLRAAPYLATRCLQKIAEENELNHPNGAQMLKNNFYVDDGLGGADYLSIATEIQKELVAILGSHGFVLKKWCANHPELLKGIPAGDQEVNLDFSSANTNTVKTLGILWLPKTDEFCIRVRLDKHQVVSKRSATSDLARLFDPLGLLAPVVVKAKMFIQQLWQYKLDWDEPLAKDLHRTWSQFRNELEDLNNLKIQRHIYNNQLPGNIQLHIFADASEKAFGAVAYLRSRSKDGRLTVRLLCAKTRVAPLKQQTLPRLELCAAVLGAQLASRIGHDLCFKNQKTFLWTDSEIVLSWINAQSSLYQTFVANRIATIQSLTLPDQWRHVPSKDNPADILSRGLSATKLQSCNLWFYGPLFLHGRETLWPPVFSQGPRMNNEIEKKRAASVAVNTVSSDDIIYKIEHNNSFRRLQRIIGYVRRFIKNSKLRHAERPTHRALTPAELEESLFMIVRTIQASDFSSEINQLEKNNEVNKKSTIVSLAPFLDKQKILRVGGRLEASTLSYDAKHQMLLPYNDPLTKLLFKMIHEENSHCGPQTLLSIVRQRFWPIRGKIMTRSTVKKCIRCTKAQPQLCQQLMGNLPKNRITPARPFLNAGVDYCGPFWIHYRIRGKKPTKAYIAVFCCFATKAIHLELVSDLTTEAFIGALKRFISRRGRCQNIYSDNATNFIGAKNQLSELSNTIYSEKGQESIMSNTSSRGIQFHFIPPRAPHFGGLWEAAVKSAKYLLLRGVATASLTQEELETTVIEIEAILNSRPLTPMSDDPNDLEVLTPGHFLIGEALTSQMDSKATTTNTSGLSHWKLLSQLKYEFWRRWSSE